MSIIYNVTIEPTKEEDRFAITWENTATLSRASFTRTAPLTAEEMQYLWQHPWNYLDTGEKFFQFLNGDAHYFNEALDHAFKQADILHLRLSTCKQTANWPFELLAHDNFFLLPHRVHLVRRVSDRGANNEMTPPNRPLKLLFMACSPLDEHAELDFEREEEAIFHITGNLAIDMVVEDSGSLEGLQSHLQTEYYDVVHLSGHAAIDGTGNPYFIMEDELGYKHRVSPRELFNKVPIENLPRVLFLSGCSTGEDSDTPANTAEGAAADQYFVEGSFAQLLVENVNIPVVLGWGRQVHDNQASLAGKMLFHELSRGKTILEGVQRARYELLKVYPTVFKPAWPLLRLFCNGMDLNEVVQKEQQVKPKPRRMKIVFLKNSRVQVLAEGFVGRRRQLQNSLRAIKKNCDKVGVLLLGTSGLGKSCLAGKICERFPHHTLIIVHGRLNTITLNQALTDAFIAAQDEKSRRILSQPIEFVEKLPKLCAGGFKKKNYLLLFDDFEQNLEGADKGKPGSLLLEAANLLKSLLCHLPFSGKMTQLIITSRYPFSLIERDRDLVADRLENVWLTTFNSVEQRKKADQLPNIMNYKEPSQVSLLLAAGHGNPRLMERLDILVGRLKEVELPALLDAIKDKQEDFIREYVLLELLRNGGADLELFLRWASIFRRPVPIDGLDAVAVKAGLADFQELLHNGMELSLVEYEQVHRSFQVTPLLKEKLLRDFAPVNQCHEAAFFYYKRICEKKREREGEDALDPVHTEEWIYHALGCGQEETASTEGSKLLKYYQENLAFQEALGLGQWILAGKKQPRTTAVDASLLDAIAGTWQAMGNHQQAVPYYEEVLVINHKIYGTVSLEVVYAMANLGKAQADLTHHDQAIELYKMALDILERTGNRGHPAGNAIINNMVVSCAAQGDPQPAIQFYTRMLPMMQQRFGENHPDVALKLNNLASILLDCGRFQDAIGYLEKALAVNQSLYGDEHPEVARNLNNLGGAWGNLGQPKKAIDYLLKSLAIWKAVYGEIHPHVAAALNNGGLMFAELDEYEHAIDLYQNALAIYRQYYGEAHDLVAYTLNNIGEAYRALKQPEQAIDYYRRAMAIDCELFGREHPNVARSLNNIGLAWEALGDHGQAIDFLQQALEVDRGHYGTNHPALGIDLFNLAEVWKGMGEYEKAINSGRQALGIYQGLDLDTHPDVPKIMNQLAGCYYALGDYKQTIEYFELAVTVAITIYGEEHEEVARLLGNLAWALFETGEKQEARDCFEQAYQMFCKLYGPQHPQTQDLAEWVRRCKEF